MHIPAREQGIRIAGAYWRAESLTTRFSNDKGFFLGAYNDSQATNAVLRNVRVQTSAAESYLINIGTNGVLMDACLANDGRIDAWNYWAAKARSEETAVGIVSLGQNVLVR